MSKQTESREGFWRSPITFSRAHTGWLLSNRLNDRFGFAS